MAATTARLTAQGAAAEPRLPSRMPEAVITEDPRVVERVAVARAPLAAVGPPLETPLLAAVVPVEEAQGAADPLR